MNTLTRETRESDRSQAEGIYYAAGERQRNW